MDTLSLLSARSGPGGLRTTLGAAPVRNAVRSTLTRMLDGGAALGPCRLRRTKFKPEKKLTAWFEVGLGTTPGSRSVAVSWWAPGTLPPPVAEQADAETEARARGCAAPFDVLARDVPDAHMRVQVAPLDPAYRGLVAMSDPSHVAALLGYPRPPRVTALRYRPGQRHVLRYDDADGGNGPTLFAKLYPDDRGRGHEQAARRLAEILDAGDDGSAAVPVAHLAEEQALVFRRISGPPLRSLVQRGDRRAGRALRQAGAVLRRIHDASPPDAARARTTADELDEVTRATAAVAHLAPSLGTVVRDVVARTRDLAAVLPGEAAVLVHGDFKTDHLLVGRRALTLIDFDKCAVADPALDVAKLLADLRWWSNDGTGEAQDAFLDGYGAGPGGGVRARALEPLFLVKLAARRVQVHQPEWSARTAAPIQLADQLLRELARA